MSQLITKLVQDEARDKKKMLKKEQQEKAKAELNKVGYILVEGYLWLLKSPHPHENIMFSLVHIRIVKGAKKIYRWIWWDN